MEERISEVGRSVRHDSTRTRWHRRTGSSARRASPDAAYRSACGSEGAIEDGAATAQAAAGDRDVGIFGGSVSRHCLRADLLDEVVLHVAPVLLGGGIRLFGGEGAERTELERISVGEGERPTDLRFRPVKQRPR
jgi:dihydrofolate reductase